MAPSQHCQPLYTPLPHQDEDGSELTELNNGQLLYQKHPKSSKISFAAIVLLIFSNAIFAALWLKLWTQEGHEGNRDCVRPQLIYCKPVCQIIVPISISNSKDLVI